jgi:hypothetical protein
LSLQALQLGPRVRAAGLERAAQGRPVAGRIGVHELDVDTELVEEY